MTARKLFVTLWDQTGDVPHIAGAVVLYPESDVLIITEDAETEVLNEFYTRAAGGDHERIRIQFIDPHAASTSRDLYNVLVPDRAPANTPKVLGARWGPKEADDAKGNKDTRGLRLTVKNAFSLQHEEFESFFEAYFTSPDYEALPPRKATALIAEKFKTDNANRVKIYEDLAERFTYRQNTLPINGIIKGNVFGNTQLPGNVPGRPVVLLWSRYSGTISQYGYNPEGDSDVIGQEQLIKLVQSLGLPVITAGHDPAGEESIIPTQQDIEDSHAPCHLGEFYKVEPIVGRGRAAQNSFLAALMQRYPGNIVQLGQKTGGMDHGALLGMPTLYIEDRP